MQELQLKSNAPLGGKEFTKVQRARTSMFKYSHIRLEIVVLVFFEYHMLHIIVKTI